ncbi:hypothetical protein L1887_59252 [Cichorium endivia]|nr:hypothetical protein L1887_59252 [Cichorium endivia]
MAARTTHPSHGLGQRHVPLGAEAPTAWSANRRRAHASLSSPDSDLEAFSHNPAHGSFAPLAFQPSAMTNCANQRPRFHGSYSYWNQNQTSFYPSVPHEISVLVELILGHLRYLLTDVPPQPILPPDNVFRPDRLPRQALGPKRGAIAPLADSRNNRIPLVRTSSELAVRRPGKAPEGAVPSPSPGPARGDPLSPRKQLEQSADSRRVRDWGPPVPSPQIQSFSREKITLPEAPADVSGLPNVAIRTDGRSAQAHAQGFAATAAPSYSSGPGTCPDGRVSAQFGTVTRLPVHPASPVLLTKNGPLGALDSVARLNEAAAPSYLFKNSHPGSSYPEGNFGGNQLLDGSISLSPLYPSQTNDLHVSIAAGLHQSFLWLRPAQA